MAHGIREWTTSRGVLQGLTAGAVAGLVLSVLAAAVAWHAPLVATNGWIRTGASLLTVFLLFTVVHRAAGMTGPFCTGLVVGLVTLIVLTQHLVFAVHGVPTSSGLVTGWGWFSLDVLAVLNVFTLIGAGFGVWLWRDGVSLTSLTDVLRAKHRL